MIKFFTIVVLALISFGATAQHAGRNTTKVIALELKAERVGEIFQLTWKSGQNEAAGYWEVQGSEDGSNFKMLGLVLGADPSETGSDFKFRQHYKKLIPGVQYYRVVLVENESAAIASNIIGLSK